MYGRGWEGLLYVGIFSLIFGEGDHQIIKFLQKNIFKNAMQKKYSDHNFTCASIVKKKTKKQNKKMQKTKKRLCL